MASSRRKLDEKHLKFLRELGSQTDNRQCFDCQQRGTTYINMTVGSFVCTSCSGILRGINPPHRVKSISMASFTPEEIQLIKSKGNHYCSAVWLGLYDAQRNPFPETKDEHKIKDFMITKYEKKRFYVEPSIAVKNMPPATNSPGSSTTATTPSSNNKSTVAGAVARPSVVTSQSTSSLGGFMSNINGSASKISTPKSQSSIDLLADLSQASAATAPAASVTTDPFASPAASVAAVPATADAFSSQESFANFDNANIFTNTNTTSTSSSTAKSAPPMAPTTFSNAPLLPLNPSSSSSSSAVTTNGTAAPASKPPGTSAGDRYAALASLDEEFKIQKVEPPQPQPQPNVVPWSGNNGNAQNNTVFGSPPSGGGFGSPNTSNFGGFVNGGNGGFGTPPTNNTGGSFFPQQAPQNAAPTASQPWTANFSGQNPFAGGGSTAASPWMNGGGSTAFGTQNGGSTAFGTQAPNQQSFTQPNPFGTSPDPNFNQFGNGVGGINGINGTNGNWANFNQQPQPNNNAKMQWANSNGAAPAVNPFMTAPQMPSNGTSFNPFL